MEAVVKLKEFWLTFTLGGCGVLKELMSNHFLFGGFGSHEIADLDNFGRRVWWSWKDWFLSVSLIKARGWFERNDFGLFALLDGVWVMKGRILDYWLIWRCQIIIYKIANSVVVLCVCVCVSSISGKGFWLNWPMVNSHNAIRLHCLCWHHCLLCAALFTMWLMPLSLYIAYILAYFPHWCILSNLDMWHLNGIWGVYLLVAEMLQ